MTDVVIVEGARTAHGSMLGGLSGIHAPDLGAAAVGELVDRSGAEPGRVDWVGLGNAVQAGVGQVPAGRATLCVAGGMESMSNAPYLLREHRRGRPHGNTELTDAMVYDSLWDVGYDAHMGELTERLVDDHGIAREDQDEYALRSNRRAAGSVKEGVFDEDYAVAYRDPAEFSQAVGDAIERLLSRNDLAVGDVDHYEVNEAFAAQTVYVRDRLGIPEESLNPLGGAVALGHPIGASGGILATTTAHTMVREDHDYGVVGMSVGGGGAIMLLLSR